MRSLYAATCLTPVSLLIALPALAETVVSTAVTTPVLTGTAADNLRISSTGSVKPASGNAVTINSNHSVRNEGTIAVVGANNSAGIVANAGVTSGITNVATISIEENFTATDSDSDGDVDGPFAQGSGRFGIRTLGTFTGNIVNGGTISIEGNSSAGIALDGALTGNLSTNSGSISVVGNDSAGIRAGDVSGTVNLFGGSVTVRGANSVGVALDGDIGGALVFQNSVTATGYRYTSAPGDVTKLDADDLLQGGPAIRIAGNVAGGILFDSRPADNSTTDTDEDDDGIADASEPTSSVTVWGSAPAVTIGSTSENVTIGAVASSAAGHGLVARGSIAAYGVYKGVSATGLSVGGTGHSTLIAGGATLGSVGANAIEANATAVRIGGGASVPTIQVIGTISATGAGTAATTSRGVVIESGATVNTVKVATTGSVIVSRAGSDGTAAAILDQAGTLSLIENSGRIAVTQAATIGDKAVAFDLSANGGGATVRQLAVGTGVTAPSIAGTMLFGGGNDLLDVADGTVFGAAKFGLGDNQLKLSGDSAMTGAVSFGTGADLVQLGGTSTLGGSIDFGGGADQLQLSGTSRFSGSLANSGGLAVTVGAGSALDVTNTGNVALSSLTTGAGSTVGVSLNGNTGAHTLLNVAGAASFGANTLIDVTLLSVGGVEGSYTIVQAGSLSGGGNLSSSVGLLPFLFTSSVTSNALAGTVTLNVARKTAAELGINQSEAAALDAVLDAVDQDGAVAGVFLDVADSETLSESLQQMLPDHAGGAFENVTKGSRLAMKALGDPNPPLVRSGGWGVSLQQFAWGTSKSIGDTASYDLDGWGVAGGIEHGLGNAGAFGLSLAYMITKDNKDDNQLSGNQAEVGAYWRGNFGPVRGYARAGVGRVSFDSTRSFSGLADGSTVERTAEGDWTGTLFSAGAGLSYEARIGRLTLRPGIGIEHFKLTEKGYEESGGGDAFNLSVEKRSSDETAANATLAAGYELIGGDPAQGWLRVELEGGRRQILSGSLGATTASFVNGDPFTLEADKRRSGWLGALRLTGGGEGITVNGEVNAEQQSGDTGIGGRLGIAFAL